jgi:CRP/FNR family cyclic AMP-dependent transcriptional regulator
MYIQQSDVLRGLGKEFVKSVMHLAHKEDHKRGFLLFREGDRANHFFILLKGRVNITLGETGHTVYTVDHPGEAFGLSSLIGRERYIASAECKEPTKLLRFSAKDFENAIEADPVNSLAFFRRQAEWTCFRTLKQTGFPLPVFTGKGFIQRECRFGER